MNEIKFVDYSQSKYKEIGTFFQGLAKVKNRQNLYGFINKEGKEVITPAYLDTREFSEGLSAVQDPDSFLWGFINKKGELVIPYQYRDAGCFSEGYASVQLTNGNWIFINKDGLRDFSGEYAEVHSEFSEGYALVRLNGKSEKTFIDKRGIIKGSYKNATHFSNGLAVVEDDKNYYIINQNFYPISTKNKSEFSKIEGNTELLFLTKNFNCYGFLTEQFEEIIPIDFEKAEKFSDGMAKVKLSSNWEGYVTRKGKIMAFSNNYQYEELNNFHQGLARVKSAATYLYGYINKKGEETIKCEYEDAMEFNEGLAGVVDTDGVFHYIDKYGKKIITLPQMYFSTLELDDKIIILSAESKEELAVKKLQVLSSIKSEIIQKVTDVIDQLAYDETSSIPESHYTRVRKPNIE
ncbi:MAG: WG repeat-containing protein [Bacilli bacterium]|nr:WG repeat-containing protein [Bacilli bacterium]